MSEKCWVVSTGSYSDYEVRAAFMDKSEAEAFARSLRRNGSGWSDSGAMVESLPLNPPLVESVWLARGYLSADGSMSAQGALQRDTLGWVDDVRLPRLPPRNRTTIDVSVWHGTSRYGVDPVSVAVAAWDEVTAERACGDKLAELAAIGYEVAVALSRDDA